MLIVAKRWHCLLAVIASEFDLSSLVQGIASDKQSAELAETVLAEIRHWDDRSAVSSSLDAVVATDQILRCCLKSTKPRPAVALIIGRALLHLHQKWSAEGFRGVGGRDASVAHAILLLENSQLAALAGECHAQTLLELVG